MSDRSQSKLMMYWLAASLPMNPCRNLMFVGLLIRCDQQIDRQINKIKIKGLQKYQRGTQGRTTTILYINYLYYHNSSQLFELLNIGSGGHANYLILSCSPRIWFPCGFLAYPKYVSLFILCLCLILGLIRIILLQAIGKNLMERYEIGAGCEPNQDSNDENGSSRLQDQDQQNSLASEQNFAGLPKILRRQKKSLQNSEVTALYDKKEKLQQFMEMIGDYCAQPIRHDILQHCERLSINIQVNMSKDTLMKLVRNRVEKMIKNKRIKKNWSEEDLKILVWVVSKYCQFHGIANVRDGMTEADWSNVANVIPGVTGKSCMFKWLSLKKNNLADNGWAEDQSLLLDQMVKKYGDNSWCRVSQELFLRNPQANKIYRCPKQCREHWNCYLNPQLKKGPWDRKEDYLLLRAVMELEGVKKWAEIVKMFNGRTENALKNRFNLIVEKELKEIKKCKKPTQLEIISYYLKKHENQFDVDEETLQFLCQKRNLITESLVKKVPKKVRVKKIKQQKTFQSEDYFPSDRMLKETRNSRSRFRESSVERRSFQQKKEDFCCKNESLLANSFMEDRKNSPIFEYDEIYEENIKMENIKMESIKLENIKLEELKEVPRTPSIWIPTPGQALQIESAGVFFVPFSEELFNKIKGQILIPCKITEAKQIIKISL